MATIRARWSRTIQNKPYEPETFELSAEYDVVVSPGANPEEYGRDIAIAASALDRALAVEGNTLVLARLAVINGPAKSNAPVEPDPLMP